MNTPRVRLSVKLMVTEFSELHEEKGLEIYSANLGVNVGAHLSFLVVITCGDFYYNWKGVNESAFPTHSYLS